MAVLSSKRLGNLGNWIRLHPFTTAGIVALAITAVQFCLRQESEWDSVYLPAAAHLWKGEDIYRWGECYLYPPFMAWAALPFLALPSWAARAAWLLVNVTCLLALLRWGWRLAGGGRVEGEKAEMRERWAALLGFICGISYVHNCLAHQQTDIVIGAALVGGCLLLVGGRPLWAATSLGLAAACKCTALLWAPYLLWRGRPLAAVWLLIVALGANLLPDLVSTSPTGRPWLEEYYHRFLQPLTASHHYVGSWGSDPIYNQSLSGMGQRWCTTSWNWTDSNCTIGLRRDPIRPALLRAGVYGIECLLLLAVLCCCGRPFRRVAGHTDHDCAALECGMVLLLMLLLSPMSSKAHFGTLLVPGFCLARVAMTRKSRALGAIVLGSVFLAVISNKDPLGEQLYTLSLWYGVVTWQTMLLLTGCLIAVRSRYIQARGQLPITALGSEAQGKAA